MKRIAIASPVGRVGAVLAAGLLMGVLWLLWPASRTPQPLAPGGAPIERSPTAPADAEPITPLPAAPSLEPAKLQLGEKLFRDPRLSRGNTMACASCHHLEQAGNDGRDRPTGINGGRLDFNVPTIFNAALRFRLNWRGNFRTLEELTEAVLLDAKLMNTTWDELLAKLRTDPEYRDSFRIYGGDLEPWQVLDALATFQRSLLTPNSRFDRWLQGERRALTQEEEQGYRLFKSYGCIACHQGVNVGGNLFQRFGIFTDRPVASAADLGRFTITGQERDGRVFRVPSLRNVAATAPYFHDGSEPSLAGAVRTMAQSQLGRSMTDEEIDRVVRFLRTLTGEYRGRPVTTTELSEPPR